MRLFIIGSIVTESSITPAGFARFCNGFGERLAGKNITLVLCSPYPDSADYEIMRGIKKAKNTKLSIELYYPQTPEIENSWNDHLEDLDQSIKLTKFRQEAPAINDLNAFKYSWLFCQIQAIANVDFVVVIGGKIAGSSNFLIRIADTKEKEIIPLQKFGGVGASFFEKKRYQLLDSWGNEIMEQFYKSADPKAIVDIIVDKTQSKKSKIIKTNKKNLTFFISYPRDRPSEADFIEMILRRRNYIVFRDDTDISASEDVPNAIKENIHKADVFIAVWCKEYACSPWCFDELNIALGTHQKDGKPLWIFRVDKTRVVPPGARKMLWYNTETREEIEGRIVSLLEQKNDVK